MSTAEIIERVETALAYLQDGARETGLARLREVVNGAGGYRPLVNLSTGHESHAVGSALVDGFVHLDATDRAGVYRAPDDTEWFGCSDGIWRTEGGAP